MALGGIQLKKNDLFLSWEFTFLVFIENTSGSYGELSLEV